MPQLPGKTLQRKGIPSKCLPLYAAHLFHRQKPSAVVLDSLSVALGSRAGCVFPSLEVLRSGVRVERGELLWEGGRGSHPQKMLKFSEALVSALHRRMLQNEATLLSFSLPPLYTKPSSLII